MTTSLPEFDNRWASSPSAPSVSVIVPARNCRDQLIRCLLHLRSSDFQDFEIIVVDDASSDNTSSVTLDERTLLVRLPQRGGPAAARNAGVAAARGRLLVFVDADVQVHRMTLQHLIGIMADPGISAAFGSYDTHPTARNLVSQFRNLLHHFVHQASAEKASTFWAGCGIIRRDVFLDYGGFDERFTRPSVEDIELGIRITQDGHQVVLLKSALCTHDKRWNLWSMMTADLCDRGIPWTGILIAQNAFVNDLNITYRQRASVVVAYMLLAVLIAATIQVPWIAAVFAFDLIMLLAVDAWSRRRCVPVAVRCVYIASLVAMTGLAVVYAPGLLTLGAALLIALIVLNRQCYRFFINVRSGTSIMGVIPLHVLYFLLCGAAFAVGIILHIVRPKLKPASSARHT